MTTAQQQVTFIQFDPPGPTVTVLLGDGFAKASNKGGWTYTPRRHNISISEYTGDDPKQLLIPCVLDALIGGGSVDAPLNTLFAMMTNLVGPRGEPGVLHAFGAGIPFPTYPWTIQTIDITDEIRLNSGPRTRVEFNVTLWQYVAPTLLAGGAPQSPAKAAVARNGTPQTSRTYTVHAGDSLWAIAVRMLGNGARWGEIAKLNNIRDPNVIRIGTVLRIPA